MNAQQLRVAVKKKKVFFFFFFCFLFCLFHFLVPFQKRAYRGVLKLQLTWTVNKVAWYDQVPQYRALFEKYAHGATAEKFLSQIEADLKQFKHPDPYMFPYYYGGTKWERNLPPHAFVADEHAHLDTWR